jgi:heat shock protein HtpX
MKRIILFFITNMLVVLTISIVTSLFGLNRYLTEQGIDYQALLVLCLVWGMSGSLISLAISRQSAKWMTGMQIVTKSNLEVAWLVSMVEQLARKAGLPVTPEVGIYDSMEVNAFATGPSRNRALVAFSSGLLNRMNRDEIEGVAAHEIAHIANGDMVTMTLLQGIINAFVMFVSRILAFVLTQNSRDDEGRSSNPYFLIMFLEMAFGILGMLVIAAFSRHREFRADYGGAKFAGKQDMIAALQRLRQTYDMVDPQPALAAFKISGGVGALFASHPPLEKRIAALEATTI